MTTTIITKHNDTTGNAPITLAHGEVAINIADKYVWVGDSSNAPILLVDGQTSSNNTWTGTQTFTGTSSKLAEVLTNAAEKITVSATAATGTINFDITTQSVLYYTTNASGNFTVNFRASSGTSLNTAMSTGQCVTAAFLVTNGSTAYYNNVVKIDGTTVTPKWQGVNAPIAGNINSVDVYTYTIVKTGSATFTVFASQVQYS